MRERLAMAVSVASVALIAALSLAFAARNNPAGAASAPMAAAPGVPSPATEAGRKVFEAQNCSTCHSIAGNGNPRSPLDNVGSTWNAEELRAWLTGTGIAADTLPAAIAKRKQRYQSLPADEMKALIAYLSTLKK